MHREPDLAARQREIAAAAGVQPGQHDAVTRRRRNAGQFGDRWFDADATLLSMDHGRAAIRIAQPIDPVLANDGQSSAFGRRGQPRPPELGEDVVAVDAVHRVWPQAGAEEGEQLVAEQDVDVGREDERRARTPDAHVLADHLEKRQPVGVREGPMHVRRNCDDTGQEVLVGSPAQRLGQGPSVRGRIPLDQDQLDRQAESPGLLGEAVDEQLHTGEKVAAMLVVARGGDDAEQRVHVLRLAFSSPVFRHRT